MRSIVDFAVTALAIYGGYKWYKEDFPLGKTKLGPKIREWFQEDKSLPTESDARPS
ncbi:MAG: hypothetical protein OXC68_12655 [Aestuariivita sp.]|nr:hypothetical protein [Aestuariivita sp.]